ANMLQAIAAKACQGNACARTPILKGNALLSAASTCAIGGCFYAPDSCSVVLMTDVDFDQAYSAATSTFRADCTLRMMGAPGTVFYPTPMVPVPPCSHDLLSHTTSYGGTIGGGSGTLTIDGKGPTAENSAAGSPEGRYTVAFDGIVDAQRAQIAGTVRVTV